MTEIVPKTIAAGVDFTASASIPAYAGPGWSLVLMLRGPKTIDVVALRDGIGYVWHVPGADTDAWTAGVYVYQVRAVDGEGTVNVIESGMRTIAPDFADTPEGADVRSPARKALDAIEAVIAKRATLDQERYRINNRELYRTPIRELMRLRAHYLREVNREESPGGARTRFHQVKFVAGG